MADLLDKRRYIFLSASFLSKQYKSIPADVVDHAIFFFGGKRSWLFPTNREEMLEARSNPAKYLEFDEEYKSLILRKEKSGHVFWLLPEKSYSKFSSFLEGLVDPTSGENYLPLILDEAWWKTGNNNHYLLEWSFMNILFLEFVPADAKFTKDTNLIITNIKAGMLTNILITKKN